ncbi:L-lactate permease [uncultured Mitsuokella sp.]|uniref:L-lactate permease n=1 Tax=uncultured Mitsuokella sp. TaxID=453120 RepID=UPI00260D90F8|nr:L-lactate permease [uncultured Mitsuokella sp.]
MQDVFSSAATFLPIALLAFFLIILRRSIWETALWGLIGAFSVGMLAFAGVPGKMAIAAVQGACHSAPILLVIFLTLLLYNAAENMGLFARLIEWLHRQTEDPVLQALLIGWLFVHLLQGASGFGIPVLLCAPILVKCGVSPARAVFIAQLGQCWGSTFGTFALGWEGLLTQMTLQTEEIAALAISVSHLFAPICVVTGWIIAFLIGGWCGMKQTFLLVLAIGLIQSIVQDACIAFLSVNPANFIAASAGLLTFFLCLRVRGETNATDEKKREGNHRALCTDIKTICFTALVYAVRRTVLAGLPITLLLAMAAVMVMTGQTQAAASAIATLAGRSYPLFAAYVGMLGSFLTASNLSSNILFGAFQEQAAEVLGLSAIPLLALQTTGGAIGTILSPSNILLGTSAVDIVGQEGRILRRTFLTAVLFAFGIGLFAIAYFDGSGLFLCI